MVNTNFNTPNTNNTPNTKNVNSSGTGEPTGIPVTEQPRTVNATTKEWLNRDQSDAEKAVVERVTRKAKELAADVGKLTGVLPAELEELVQKLRAFVAKVS